MGGYFVHDVAWRLAFVPGTQFSPITLMGEPRLQQSCRKRCGMGLYTQIGIGTQIFPAIDDGVPKFPARIASVIERTYSINAEKHATTVLEFWQALEHAAPQ
jgi:hypothetical protein